MFGGDHIHNDKNKFGLHNHKKLFVFGIFALILALAAYSLAQNAQDTADINNVLEIVVNNTNLAPSVAGHPPGTGERVSGVTYWANDSPIEVFVFAHASSAGATAEIHLFINGTKVADTSGRPLGAAEESNKTIIAIIPRGANYSFEFNNAHHYEWREYPVLSGKNGTLSVNQTFITNGSSFNSTYDATTKAFNSNYSSQTFPNSTIITNKNNIAALQTNDTYFNGTGFPQSTNFRNDSINNTIIRNYSAHIKTGTFTRDVSLATGTQTITGVGFKPAGVTIYGVVGTTSMASWGMSDCSTQANLDDVNQVVANSYQLDTNYIITFQDGLGNIYNGGLSSCNDDGFTISWAKTGSITGTATMVYQAHR